MSFVRLVLDPMLSRSLIKFSNDRHLQSLLHYNMKFSLLENYLTFLSTVALLFCGRIKSLLIDAWILNSVARILIGLSSSTLSSIQIGNSYLPCSKNSNKAINKALVWRKELSYTSVPLVPSDTKTWHPICLSPMYLNQPWLD